MANGNDAVSRRFELLESKLKQQETARTQQEKEALKRRFASIGGLGSGASIKTEQLADQASSRRLGEGQAALGIAESQERQRLAEIKEGRQFQTSERESGQSFAGSQAAANRKFATGERMGSQEFAGGQAAAGRKFATGERLGSQSFAGSQAAANRRFATGERMGSQEFAGGQAAAGRAHEQGILKQQLADTQAGRAHEQGILKQQLDQKAEQFGRQFTESARQFDVNRTDRINIAQDELALKNAINIWQEQLARAEYDLNLEVTMKNLDMAIEDMKNGDPSVIESIFGASPSFDFGTPGSNSSGGSDFSWGSINDAFV